MASHSHSHNHNHNHNHYHPGASQTSVHGGHCVCQICTCTKHKCPPGMMPYSPDAMLSTMKNDYPKHPLEGKSGSKKTYQYAPTNYSPDIMKTTNQNDYTPKKGSQPYRHPRDEPVASNVPFNGESEYRTNYLKNPIELQPAKSNQHKQGIMNNVPFQGSSTYNDNYKGTQGQQRPTAKAQQHHTANIPFEGASTYKQEYKEYELPRNQPIKKEAQSPSKVPFDGHTSYQDEYKRYRQNAYEKEPCPIYSLPQVPRNCSPGKTHIHYHDEVRNWA